MQHLCYLDSFMDETDREVMSLTDRAFKSLCIGDEAIYNDSEFSPPLVSCYKPLAEEVPKKTQESCSFTVKKHETHPLNGVNDMPWHINKNSSLFTAFAAKKNGDTTKMLNGDSWDKSALLSIQRELSEFSSDYQNSIADKHGFQVKNHLKSSEKSNKSSKDTSSQSGKSSKSKHSKSSKLRKLNSRNFFLHSELSPFQSWRDLNKFPFGLENIEIFQSNGPPEWYDSPLYKKLTMSHSLHVPGSNKEVERQNTSVPALEDKPEAEITQHTANAVTSIPLKPEKHSESETHTKSQIVLASSGSEQRCQSEGDHSAPWRKNRSRAKSVVPPVGQSLMSSLSCEKTKAVDEDALPIKKEVRTMEEQGSTSSTPFNILQLLTPVIPSRQGTGSSEVLQAVLSPSTLDLPLLPEREKRPSPEIKREGYKSIASSLLFNLKDNRKRVKTMYSPPKFKGLEPADQNKLSPLIEQVLTKDGQEVAEIPDAEITSAVHQKAPASLPPEAAGQQKYTPSGHINGGLPDDFLALSLLQPLKSNKSPVVNKATYPSLNLYRKASPGESDTKTMQPTLSVPGSHPGTKHGQNTGHPEMQGKDLQRKPTPALNLNKPTDHPNSDGTLMNVDTTKRTAGNVQTESADAVTLKEKYPLAFLKKHSTKSDAPTLSGSRNLDNLGETGTAEQRPVKDKGRMEAKPKHLFSARQNNYIKSQRYVSVDDEECGHGGEEVASAQGRTEVEKGNSGDELSRISESANVREERKGKPNVGLQKVKEVVDGKMEDAPIRESVENAASNIKDNFVPSKNVLGVSKGDGFSMKGNTSAKIALFAAKEQVHTKAAVALKKENQAMDKYELAKAALEEVIAERNQRKKQSQNLADDQDLVTQQQDDYKQANQSQSSQKDTLEAATKDRRGGRKGFSDLKSSSRIVQSMSERDTKHGESHVAEFTTSRDRKGQLDCLTVPEEEEMRSAVSSVSEGIESCGTSAGDTVEETTFIPLPTEDAEESRAPSERSGSACSGLESQSQSKPPAVPPKTEKALRRAMKLTTRRIQKADSKSKSERKGRSSEKNTSHKPERRHHSSDKVHSGRSEHRAHSIDLGCTKQSPRENDKDTLLLKTHRRERHAREYSNQESHYEETPRLDSHANQNSTQAEPKNFSRNQRHIEKEDQLEARNGETHSERTGRTSGRYLPEKLDRRAQSLDRFLTEKPELVKRPPLRQNSVERTYASNIVTQSFPMTQRKLLQDPDSGQYFVVDMPVQVKTKTFFDPETGSYVQLPVQSPEASVPQAQSMEVVKAPPLVLYHGFVPMPVSTLPAQKSTIRLGSVVTPDDLELFESGEMERHDAIYQKPNPYPEPMHVSQEHLAGVEIDSVR
ncbi:uncharacterized protein [Salminus brasiliensis]|uniref:uncharacterized protein n=1 Tax=Salminus brasiliensis TaxID=930266 RepID=UPI003B83055B